MRLGLGLKYSRASGKDPHSHIIKLEESRQALLESLLLLLPLPPWLLLWMDDAVSVVTMSAGRINPPSHSIRWSAVELTLFSCDRLREGSPKGSFLNGGEKLLGSWLIQDEGRTSNEELDSVSYLRTVQRHSVSLA